LAGVVSFGAPAMADSVPSLSGEGQDGVINSQPPVMLNVSEEPQNLIPASTPTLGENSAYKLTETTNPTSDSLILYEIKNETKSIEYTDANGAIQNYEYTTKTANEKYYNLNYNITTPTNNRINASNQNLGDVNEHFVENLMTNLNGTTSGAAITLSNNSQIGKLVGDFIANHSQAKSHAWGGAININSNSSIASITGDFIGNISESDTNQIASGAAIHVNNGTIGVFDADGNYVSGGITGNFINNSAKTTGNSYSGGAIGIITQVSRIGNIDGAFINNSATCGGAIYNLGSINSINGIFINNKATKNAGALALNYGSKLKSISGIFINNSAGDNGGAISANKQSLDYISADFIGNHAVSTSGSTSGGAINFTNSDVKSLSGNFIGNYAESTQGNAQGGATTTIIVNGDVNSSFINNHLLAKNQALGGAVAHLNGVNILNGDFVGNYAISQEKNAYGGAIAFTQANQINGSFINNYIIAKTDARGGAIYFSGDINEINGNFIGNYAKTTGEGSGIWGGTIFAGENKNTNINGDFIGNYAESAGNLYGGVIFNYLRSHFGTFKSNFINNYAIATGELYGGVIQNTVVIDGIQGDFINNYASTKRDVYGGAIYNEGTIGNITGSFLNNYAKTSSKDFYALGGAVFTNNSLIFTADGSDEKTALSQFSGNYTEDSRGVIPNAIFVRTNKEVAVKEDVTLNDGTVKNLTTGYTNEVITPEITLNSVNGGLIQFDDQIDGGEVNSVVQVDKDAGSSTTVAQTLTRDNQYNLHLTGDSTSNIIFNNSVINANITMDNVNVTVKNAQDFNFAKGDGINSLTLNSGSLNFLTMGVSPLHLQSLNLNGGTINIANSDVDLSSKTMGGLIADSYGDNPATAINLSNLTVVKDMKSGTNDVDIPFVDKRLGENVSYSGGRDLYSKILKYHTTYNPSSGSFSFRRIGGPGGYNPAVLSSSVAAQAGAYVAQTAALNQAFNHADTFMNNSKSTRFALSNGNTYAINTNNLLYSNNDSVDKSLWVQPYASFESIGLKNGPKVDTISYGTLVGGNGDLKELRNGWSTVTTAYAGYNGSSQSYSGINVYQNGGLLGATQTWYKGNFYTALTANVGASVGEAHNQYGHDDFTMLMAGVASKTGYNYEFKEGKYILQPSMLIGYSFINTFDYTSAAGVRIKNDPLNSIQLRPNLKFVANLKNGWQPYANVGVVWNVLNDTKVTAEDITLPEMSIKPYVEYGVGIQKRWKDKFTGYVQAMIRNGGRNGIALTAGFRWSLGNETPVNKVDAPSASKIVKQINPQIKSALKAQKSTRTSSSGILKQL